MLSNELWSIYCDRPVLTEKDCDYLRTELSRYGMRDQRSNSSVFVSSGRGYLLYSQVLTLCLLLNSIGFESTSIELTTNDERTVYRIGGFMRLDWILSDYEREEIIENVDEDVLEERIEEYLSDLSEVELEIGRSLVYADKYMELEKPFVLQRYNLTREEFGIRWREIRRELRELVRGCV